MKHTQELKRVVDKINPGLLDMDKWQCGAVACIAGHCALDPYFQEQGLEIYTFTPKLDKISYSRRKPIVYLRLAGTNFPNQVDGAFESLALLFDITISEAWDLFSPGMEVAESEYTGKPALEAFKERLRQHLGYDLWQPPL